MIVNSLGSGNRKVRGNQILCATIPLPFVPFLTQNISLCVFRFSHLVGINICHALHCSFVCLLSSHIVVMPTFNIRLHRYFLLQRDMLFFKVLQVGFGYMKKMKFREGSKDLRRHFSLFFVLLLNLWSTRLVGLLTHLLYNEL